MILKKATDRIFTLVQSIHCGVNARLDQVVIFSDRIYIRKSVCGKDVFGIKKSLKPSLIRTKKSVHPAPLKRAKESPKSAARKVTNFVRFTLNIT